MASIRVRLDVDDDELAAPLTKELREEGVEAGPDVDDPAVIVVDGTMAGLRARLDEHRRQWPRAAILLLAEVEHLQRPPPGADELAGKPLRPGELCGRVRLLSRRRRQHATAREVLLATAVEAAGDIIEITTPEPIFEYVNPAFERVLGVKAEDAIGRTPASLIRSDMHEPGYFKQIDETVRTGKAWNGLLISRAADGALVYLETTIAPVVDEDGETTHHVAVKRDITERLEAEAELRKINAELERARDDAVNASHSKSQFLANMSHELRTPLNAIIGYSEMLAEEAGDLGDTAGSLVADLGKIKAAGDHLLGLINDVLDLSKIEAGRTDLYLEEFDLAETVQRVAGTVAALVEDRGNTLVVDCDRAIGTMRADLTKFRQSLLNLLSNANKFTERGRIELSVASTERAGRDWLEISVTDDGIGMSPDQLRRLFQPFVQADASTTRRYGGTGLGLTISQRFCEMMGGRIDVRSRPNQGSTFVMRLPRRVDEQPPAPTAPSDGPDLPQVLVIDDDPTVHELLTRALARRGFRVACAAGGPEGLEMARSLRPDVVVLDVMMPKMDGWSVLTVLKEDADTMGIPVVMLTMVDRSEVGFALGAVDYVVKPFQADRLASILRRHCCVPRAHVLVVDDDPVSRDLMVRTLTTAGHRVTEAQDGSVGLAAVREHRPDLVLLDLLMPVMDGFTFLDHLHDDEELCQTPVVVVTAKTLTPQERESLKRTRMVLQRGGYNKQELLDLVGARIRDALRTAAE